MNMTMNMSSLTAAGRTCGTFTHLDLWYLCFSILNSFCIYIQFIIIMMMMMMMMIMMMTIIIIIIMIIIIVVVVVVYLTSIMLFM